MEEKNNMEGGRVFTQQEVEGIVTQVNNQARAQCENIAKRCQYLEGQLINKRLDYLFKVIENSGSFSMEFVQKCAEDIEYAFTAPEDTKVEDTKEVTE